MKDLRRKGHFLRPAETRGKFNDGGRSIKKRDKAVYKRIEIGQGILSNQGEEIIKENQNVVSLH